MTNLSDEIIYLLLNLLDNIGSDTFSLVIGGHRFLCG